MLPCENSLAGRVPDIHRLLPDSGLAVVGEHFQRVEHCLLAPKGATLATLRRGAFAPAWRWGRCCTACAPSGWSR